jgi:hypothetical protein
MNSAVRNALAVFLCLAAPQFAQIAHAHDFDGKKPLICATVEAIDCSPGTACSKGIPDDMGAPSFLRVDFKKKQITGTERTTDIRYMDKDDSQLLMQGTELGFAWTIIIDAQGKMSVSLIDSTAAITLFGSCTTL